MREQLCMQGLGVAACFLLECCYLIYNPMPYTQPKVETLPGISRVADRLCSLLGTA
jgi:hypothetical protein